MKDFSIAQMQHGEDEYIDDPDKDYFNFIGPEYITF